LCDAAVCREAVAGIDVVFHLAALASVPQSLLDPWANHAANVNATMRLLEACAAARVARVVYSSSSAVYGDTDATPKTEATEPLPRSPYAASKLAGEQYVLAFARAGVLEGVALRYFNVFGPRQSPHSAYAAVIPSFLQAALEERPATLYGDGRQTRDFIYVEDVVNANLLAAAGPRPAVNGWVVNIGAGVPTSLLALLDAITHVSGRRLLTECRPPRPGDVHASLASLDRAVQVLRYRPTIGLEEGLRRTWVWFSESAKSRVSTALHRSKRLAARSATGS